MSFPSFSIRNIEVKNALVLAPMSGVTCPAFRRLIKELNGPSVGLLISEFISVEAMTRKVNRSLGMMRYRPQERPFGIQIFGYDIQRMSDAAKMVQDSGADLLDINCGCPAPKVVRNGGGCELMRQPEHLQKILASVRKSISIPLTMKFRSGWDDCSKNALEIAKIAEGEGVEALTVHGRTRAQLYRGEADWNAVRTVAEAVSVPVSGSGDIVDLASAKERFAFGAKGLYIGRGAIRNPLIFSDIAQGRDGVARIEASTQVQILELYLKFLLEDFPPHHAIGRIKQLVSQMGRGYPWSKDICRANTLEAQGEILQRVRDGSYRNQRSHCAAECVSDNQSSTSLESDVVC